MTLLSSKMLQRRHFLRRLSSKAYVQCRFNGEILTTDPAEQTATPIWDTELAWDIDAKVLGFLRSQRATLKLICYSIDSQDRRESLGYVMLDLRAATQDHPPFPEVWHPLVNIKTATGPTVFRPELKISFAVRPKLAAPVPGVAAPVRGVGSLAAESLPRMPKLVPQTKPSARFLPATANAFIVSGLPAIPSSAFSLTSITSVPIKLVRDGVYQLGSNPVADQFTLRITISFAEHLPALLDASEDALPTRSGAVASNFFFLYSFLGIDIATQRFDSLASPNFPAESASVQFQSDRENLCRLLLELGRILVFLCRDQQTIGFADVPLMPLIDASDKEPPAVERVYPLYNAKEELPLAANAKPPGVAISMSLSRDSDMTPALKHNELPAGQSNDQVDANNNAAPLAPSQPLSRHSSPNPALGAHASRDAAPSLGPLQGAPEPSSANSIQDSPQTGMVASPVHKPTAWHQFRFSIELRSLHNIQIRSANVYLRYTYPPFGSSSPTLTHPIEHIQRTSNEHILPHSFCAFEFVMSPARLRTYLEAVPLIVELWHKDENTHDVLLGNASVDLSTVLSQRRVVRNSAGQHVPISSNGENDVNPAEQQSTLLIQSTDVYVSIMSTGQTASAYERVSDLRVVLALEDFGVVEDIPEVTQDAHMVSNKASTHIHGHAAAFHENHVGGRVGHGAPLVYAENGDSRHVGGLVRSHSSSESESAREMSKSKAALEFELWRQEEEAKFRKYLREREEELNVRLADEWRQRERERESQFRRKLDDYKTLEAQLSRLTVDVEERERALQVGERNLTKKREDSDRDVQRKLDEARDATRRLQDEFRHRVEMEKQRATDAESQRLRAVREREEIESRHRALEIEFLNFKKSTAGGPETGLRAELSSALQAKAVLEKQVEALRKSKKYYKTELRRLFDELAKMRAKAATEAQDRVQKERRDMDRLRVELLAKEQLGFVQMDREKLVGVRQDLDALGAAIQETAGHGALAKDAGSPPKNAPEAIGSSTASQIEHLRKEKESLLATGIYRPEDELVREFDTRISRLLASDSVAK